MEKTIDVDIQEKLDLVENYDKSIVCHELIDFIIARAKEAKKCDTFKICVNRKCPIDHDTTKLIKDGLEKEYQKAKKYHSRENLKQLFEVVVGIACIKLSTITQSALIEEILLIGAWVTLWEAIELEIFSEAKEIADIRLLRKLKNCEIIEK